MFNLWNHVQSLHNEKVVRNQLIKRFIVLREVLEEQIQLAQRGVYYAYIFKTRSSRIFIVFGVKIHKLVPQIYSRNLVSVSARQVSLRIL